LPSRLGVPVVARQRAREPDGQAAHLGDRRCAPAPGADVRELQQALGQAGFKVKVDGRSAPDTCARSSASSAPRAWSPAAPWARARHALKRALRGSSANVNGGFSDNPNETARTTARRPHPVKPG
jgi:hypothetical protein